MGRMSDYFGGPPKPKAERDEAIWRALLRGRTQTAVAHEFGISVVRVSQICARQWRRTRKLAEQAGPGPYSAWRRTVLGYSGALPWPLAAAVLRHFGSDAILADVLRRPDAELTALSGITSHNLAWLRRLVDEADGQRSS